MRHAALMMTAEQHDNKRSRVPPRDLSSLSPLFGLRMARSKRCPYNQERPDSGILVILESAYVVVVPSLNVCWFSVDCSIRFCESQRYVPLIWISLTFQYNLIIDAMICSANFPTGVRATTLTDYDYEATAEEGLLKSETGSVSWAIQKQ